MHTSIHFIWRGESYFQEDMIIITSRYLRIFIIDPCHATKSFMSSNVPIENVITVLGVIPLLTHKSQTQLITDYLSPKL